MAKKMAKYYSSPQFSANELFSEAISKMPTIDKSFVPNKHISFSTYVYRSMSATIKQYKKKKFMVTIDPLKIEHFKPYKYQETIPDLEKIIQGCKFLTDRQRKVAELRLVGQIKTREECGKILGMSATRISQLEKSAISKLFLYLKHQKDYDDKV